MLGITVQVLMLILWGIFFLWNVRSIIYNTIDAGRGILWALVSLLVIAGAACVDPAAFAFSGPLPVFCLLIAQFIIVFLLHEHELRLTEIRRKNNELAMQIALIYDHMKYFEKKPRIVKRRIGEGHRGDE